MSVREKNRKDGTQCLMAQPHVKETSEEIQPTLLALSSLLKVLKVPKVSKCWTLLAGRSPSLSTLFESVESAESVNVLDTFIRQVPLTFDSFKKDKRDGNTFKRDKSS